MKHFPELVGTLSLIVVGHGQLRAEEEVADRVPVEDAVDENAPGVVLKIDAVILAAITVKCPPVALNPAEILTIQATEILGKDLKLRKQIEL